MKPQQDKFVKDKLLNEIFQEIADENADTGETPYQEEKSIDYSKELVKKRKLQTIRLRIIIVLLVILILYVLFNPNDDTSDLHILDSKTNMYSIPKANQIPTEEELRKTIEEAVEEKKEVLTKGKPVIKISEKTMILDVPTPNAKTLTVEKPRVEPKQKPKQKPKTEREKAKNTLMQQMQN